MSLKAVAIIASLTVGVAPGVAQTTSREYYVDLVSAARTASLANEGAPTVPSTRRFSGTEGPGVVSDAANPPGADVELQLSAIDRPGYQIGDVFFYEIVVKNNGRAAIRVPTAFDSARVARDMPGATMAVLALTFSDAILGSQTIGEQFLYGSDVVPNTSIILSPGERVRIRAQGRWFLGSGFGGRRMLGEWTRDIDVHAVLRVIGPGSEYVTASSTSAVRVQLRK